MIRIMGMLALLFGVTQIAIAGTQDENVLTHHDLEQVGKIRLVGDVHSWTRVDDDTVIVWSTAFRPYLVELSRKVPALRFANAIAVTSTSGQILEKFDNVIVDGIRYPIKAIYELDRESARNVQRDRQQR